MKVALLIALASAGCSFDASGSGPGLGPDPDPDPGGASPSGPDGGGGGVAPSEPPDASASVLLATLPVPADGTPVASTIALRADTAYQLVVTGTVDVFEGRWFCDAEWFWDRYEPEVTYDSSSGVDLGLTLDGQPVDPSAWGDFQTDHVYELEVTGKDAPLEVGFLDPDYRNNGDSTMVVEIHGPP